MENLFMTEIECNLDEVKESIISFYSSNQKACDDCFEKANSTKGIYEEIETLLEYNKNLLKTSVIVLTANEFEKNILHMRAKGKKKIKHMQINCSNNTQYPLDINVYFLDVGKFHIAHLEANQTGSYTIGGSADLVRYIINNPFCSPSAIISFGICFGNDFKKQDLGDTIISKKVYPYFISAKVNEVELTVTDNNIFETRKDLLARLNFLNGQKFFGTKNVYIGNIITGEAVINNSIAKKIFTKAATNQPVLGGEMESYGLYKECQAFQYSIPCLTVKSICDWGVVKNIDEMNGIDNFPDDIKDRIQAFAANAAYNIFEKMFLEDAKLFKESIYDVYVKKIESLKNEESQTINDIIIEEVQKTLEEERGVRITKTFLDLLLRILVEKKYIQQYDNSNNVFLILL